MSDPIDDKNYRKIGELRAEIRDLEAENDRLEAHVSLLADSQEELTAEVERLKSLLAEAHEAVCNWGSYAGEYFQEKWGWKEDCEKFAPFQEFYPKEEPLSPEQKQEWIEKYMAPYIKKDRPDA